MVNLEKQYDQYWLCLRANEKRLQPNILASYLYGAVDSALLQEGNKLLDSGAGKAS